MRLLKKMLLSLALILLLAGGKTLFAKAFPVSTVFHYNLLSCLQIAVLLWAVSTGLAASLSRNSRQTGRQWLISTCVFLGCASLAEITCILLAHHPAYIPKRLLPPFSAYYEAYQRDILQFDPAISRYDTSLFYKMKANNTAIFSNIEYADTIRTDSLGFRDDKNAIHTASIVCLGDSYTLGWGVRQQEAWPQQLGQMLHLPVLNTGMASYGTVRELRSIGHLPMKPPHLIIIQYCYNDLDENEAYIHNNYSLPVSPATTYADACNEMEWSKRYFPGKCFFTLLKMSLHLPPRKYPIDSLSLVKIHVPAFLDVLKHSALDFDSVDVIVFDIGAYSELSLHFAKGLQRALATPENRRIFKDHVQALSIHSVLAPSDYYLLDTHPRSSGHQKIAQALAHLIAAQVRGSTAPLQDSLPSQRPHS